VPGPVDQTPSNIGLNMAKKAEKTKNKLLFLHFFPSQNFILEFKHILPKCLILARNLKGPYLE